MLALLFQENIFYAIKLYDYNDQLSVNNKKYYTFIYLDCHGIIRGEVYFIYLL